MGLFVRNQSIAITWNSHECRALRIASSGNGCRILGAWHGELGKNGDSLPEMIANAYRAIGGKDTDYVIVGGGDNGWGYADLQLPITLKGEELKNAAAFELSRKAPLPPERLRWGYRIINKDSRGGVQHLRLCFVKSDQWNNWLKAIAGLHHIDIMLPPMAAVDPLFEGQEVLFVNEGRSYCYRSLSKNARQVELLGEDAEAPTFQQAFPDCPMELGPLKEEEAPALAEYATTALLAIYGLTESLSRDAKSMIPLPEQFQPRRHLLAKGIAGICLLYLLAMAIYVSAMSLQAGSMRIRTIENEIARTKKELAALKQQLSPANTDRLNLLNQEITENTPSGPDFPTALLEITNAIPADSWISNSLEWRNGVISFQLQTPSKDLELAGKLEDSPYLGDVTEKFSTYNQASRAHLRRFELTVRLDTPEEAQALKLRKEKEAQRQREEASQKPAAEEQDSPEEHDEQ